MITDPIQPACNTCTLLPENRRAPAWPRSRRGATPLDHVPVDRVTSQECSDVRTCGRVAQHTSNIHQCAALTGLHSASRISSCQRGTTGRNHANHAILPDVPSAHHRTGHTLPSVRCVADGVRGRSSRSAHERHVAPLATGVTRVAAPLLRLTGNLRCAQVVAYIWSDRVGCTRTTPSASRDGADRWFP